jgi:5-methylcytosine-specific restriction endonuclease McrA
MNDRLFLIPLVAGALLFLSIETAWLGVILIAAGIWLILWHNRGLRRQQALSRSEGWPQIRRVVWERDGKQCRVCRRPVRLSFCDVHHLTPRSKGGGNETENLIVLCKPCHAKMPNHQHLLRYWQYRS